MKPLRIATAVTVTVAAVAVVAVGCGGPTTPAAPPLGSSAPSSQPSPTPATTSGQQPSPRDEVKWSENNLRAIAKALGDYHDTYNAMPNNTADPAGKPLLSWRVLILPYLEETPLYRKFKLDEPWDSEANKKLVAEMPKVYRSGATAAGEGMTFYRGFAGPGALFEAGAKLKVTDITDGTSNTVAVVEAGEPCPWTKPDDLPFARDKPLPKLGGPFGGDFHVAMCDGKVWWVSKTFDADALKKAITRNGGEAHDADRAFPMQPAR